MTAKIYGKPNILILKLTSPVFVFFTGFVFALLGIIPILLPPLPILPIGPIGGTTPRGGRRRGGGGSLCTGLGLSRDMGGLGIPGPNEWGPP